MTMNLMLMFGLLVLACFTGGSLAENAFTQYWEEHIGLPQPPQWLAAKASPLTPHQEATILKLLEDKELASHQSSFCELANLACSTNALVKKLMLATVETNLPSTIPWNEDKEKYETLSREEPTWAETQGGLPYFRESMVKKGGSIAVPDLRDPFSYRSFLPRSLASIIPFSLARVKETKNIFGVMEVESHMDGYMVETIALCEKGPVKGEQCSCATSAENLMDFVVEKLGPHVKVWSTESVEGSYENATIGAMKVVHRNMNEQLVICHSLPFYFQVYYCHIFPKVRVFAVDMVVDGGKKVNHATMACHYDTSAWNPKHIAFKLLGFGPGRIEICHWVNQNGMIFTKTTHGRAQTLARSLGSGL